MTSIIKQIVDRMKLRKPQEESLQRLKRIHEALPMGSVPASQAELRNLESQIAQLFPGFEAFERNFPNFCFELATGVGKTRLMGAMISYLSEAKRIRNFIILAPNTTITEKLVREFSNPNDPKYVFKGLPEFANRSPQIVTKENYDNGSGLRRPISDDFDPESITINIFNIALLHTDDRKIRHKNEKIEASMSYFEFLASQRDLVVFMDEAHRCRAKAGAKTIEELKPILGIELTATAQTESTKNAISFRNVIYRFTLPEAIKAGYLKRLGIGGRSNFDCSKLSEADLEKLKLADGITVHRNLQAELWHYTNQRKLESIKPFVLVIAKDKDHANHLEEMIKSPSFFNGMYAEKVLTVYSQQDGEEKEETVRKLLAVESPDSPVEIVIHVNMLREGWDVSNLYTIVPLRPAKSLTLIVQSLGRGSRLPLGKLTGVDLLDRLYVVYHEKFEKVVAETETYLEVIENVDLDKFATEPPEQITVYPKGISAGSGDKEPSELLNETEEISQPPENLELGEKEIDVSRQIKIPRIIIQPDPTARPGKFLPFTLELKGFRLSPADSTIIVIDPHLKKKTVFHSKVAPYINLKPEEAVAHVLLDCPGVADTDENAPIALDLADQMIRHLRSYLADEDQVKVVVHQQTDRIINEIYRQMQLHEEPKEEKMIYSIGKGFVTFETVYYLNSPGEKPQDYRTFPQGKRIESILFTGFKKSVYPISKFQSDAERRFVCILESDEDVISWVKPPRGQFSIFYEKESRYEPDFVIETRNGKYLCEVKDRTKLQDPIVIKKAWTSIQWCKAANESTDKEWKYLLIPDNEIILTATFSAYSSRYEWMEPK